MYGKKRSGSAIFSFDGGQKLLKEEIAGNLVKTRKTKLMKKDICTIETFSDNDRNPMGWWSQKWFLQVQRNILNRKFRKFFKDDGFSELWARKKMGRFSQNLFLRVQGKNFLNEKNENLLKNSFRILSDK